MEIEESHHFDKKEFLKFILNDKDLYDELILITIETLAKGKTDILESYATKDIKRINEVAHLLKGHSMTMYFSQSS